MSDELKERIQNDLKGAVKNREELKSSVLRLLLAAIFNKEKEKRYKLSKRKPELEEKDLEKESQLTGEEVIDVIYSEIKKRKESIELFEKGKRDDLVEKERKEKEILEKYLPTHFVGTRLTEEEIKKIAGEAIKKVGAKEIKDYNPPTTPQGKNIYGKVMAELMPKVKGRAEGSVVSQIVKELLIPQK